MLNVVALMGRLVYEPELKTTQNGTNVCSFRIAVDRSFARQGEERKADFIDVTAWRQTAEFVSKYFHKGSMIAIEGSLQTRQYQDKNGNNCTATEVLASQVSFCGGKAAEKPGVRDFDQQTKIMCAKQTPLTAPRRSLRTCRSIRRAVQTTFRSSTTAKTSRSKPRTALSDYTGVPFERRSGRGH